MCPRVFLTFYLTCTHKNGKRNNYVVIFLYVGRRYVVVVVYYLTILYYKITRVSFFSTYFVYVFNSSENIISNGVF